MFVLKNFLVPILFFLSFRWWGAKPAIVIAVAAALFNVVFLRLRKERLPSFFVIASVFTVLFGGIDLLSVDPRYFKIMPFAENALLGTVFLTAALARLPLLQWFAKDLPARLKPAPGEISERYIRNLTFIWSAYFCAKAFVYLYFAFCVDLGELIVLRSLIGNVSIALILGGEIIYRRSKQFQRSMQSG